VLRNSTIDFSRARDRRPALIGEAAFETVALGRAVDPIGQFEESLHLYQAIGQLPPRQMDVILLQFSHGYSVDEVAAALGITAAGVRSTARHAKRRLQHAYGVRRALGPPADLTTCEETPPRAAPEPPADGTAPAGGPVGDGESAPAGEPVGYGESVPDGGPPAHGGTAPGDEPPVHDREPASRDETAPTDDDEGHADDVAH
jgi:DNA-binding CsgD family transcriptional regulator